MEYLLDTNICIYIIKKKPEEVFKKFNSISFGNIGISSVTLSELQYGVEKSANPRKNQQALNEFLIPLEILPFDHNAAHAYGKIRANLEKAGSPIGCMDMLIAAHAFCLDVTLITNNEKEFRRINNLKIANWVLQ